MGNRKRKVSARFALPELETLADRVIWARERKGWTRAELARAVGATYDQIAKIEQGEVVQPRNIMKLGEVLDAPPAWLQFGITELEQLTTRDVEAALLISELSESDRKTVLALISSLLGK